MDSSRISIRYAKAAYEFALERGEDKRLYEEMKVLEMSFSSLRVMHRILQDPTVKAAEKMKILITAAGNDVSESYRKLLELVIGNKRESYMFSIALMFQKWYRKQKGIVITKLITTEPVSDEVKQEIVRVVADEIHKDVDLVAITDPDIIGGFVLEMEDKRLDTSIRYQLNQLKQKFINN